MRPQDEVTLPDSGQRVAPELSVVLPCLDEAETLEVCIFKARRSAAEVGIATEIVVADNGSTDGSRDIATRAGARVVPVSERGYGAALRGGIDAARGEYIIMADCDDSYALDDLGPFVAALRDGGELVMGNRFAGGIEPGAMPFLHRYLGNPVLSYLGRRLFRSNIGDFHCGMRGFRRDKFLELGLQTSGMEFASEMVVKSALANFDIREVPTTLKPDGRSRPPHLRTWRDGWRHLRFLMLFSPRWLFLIPGITLLIAGLVGMAALIPGPRTIAGLEFDIHALIYAHLAVVVGAHIIFLAAFVRVYLAQTGLLPPLYRRTRRFADAFSLERLLIVGLIVLGLGISGSVVAVLRWGGQPLSVNGISSMMRLIVPSVTAVALGIEACFAAFVLGVQRIDVRL